MTSYEFKAWQAFFEAALTGSGGVLDGPTAVARSVVIADAAVLEWRKRAVAVRDPKPPPTSIPGAGEPL